MEISYKIQNLKRIADELESRIISYSKKENPNSNYINYQYQLIKDIRDVYDGLLEIEPLDVWLLLIFYFKQFQQIDKDGYIIYLPLRRNPKKERFIQLDLTQSEGVSDMEA